MEKPGYLARPIGSLSLEKKGSLESKKLGCQN